MNEQQPKQAARRGPKLKAETLVVTTVRLTPAQCEFLKSKPKGWLREAFVCMMAKEELAKKKTSKTF